MDYIPKIGDIVEMFVYRNKRVPCEVAFVYPDNPNRVRLFRMDKPVPSFDVIIDDKIQFTGNVVPFNRKTLHCPQCENFGIEIGTLGTIKPVYVCFVCNTFVNSNWIKPIELKKRSRGRKKKELVSMKNSSYDAVSE